MSRASDMRKAARHVERAVAHLADAARLLALHDHIQEARTLDTCGHEAAQALCGAEADEDRA